LFYALEKEWMASFLVFLDDPDAYTHRSISNYGLLETSVTSNVIPLEDSIVSCNDLYADHDLHIISEDTIVAKNTAASLGTQLKEGLVAGQHYVLVGSALWTFLSSRYRFDTALPFETRFLSSKEKEQLINEGVNTSDLVVQVYPTATLDSSFVAVPSSGHFEYSIPEKNKRDFITLYDGGVDDMVSAIIEERVRISVFGLVTFRLNIRYLSKIRRSHSMTMSLFPFYFCLPQLLVNRTMKICWFLPRASRLFVSERDMVPDSGTLEIHVS
jgi:hypothetical protein